MRTVDTFYVLDLDRCLLHTARFQALFNTYLHERNVVREAELVAAQKKVEATGGSFDVVSYFRPVIEEIGWQVVKKEFLAHLEGRTDELFFGDAQQFLARIRASGVPFGILTYGGQEWQQLKLQALGLLNMPHMVTANKRKGQQIADFMEDRVFKVSRPLAHEELMARQVCLIDDKAISFAGLPNEAFGFWLVPDESAIDVRQAGDVGSNVQKVSRLMDIRLA